ncbi:MAG TPA: NrfD/PsrC family molybdoenzyme membrane anchor subunit [Anaerolineales bacterium]|nr:NrfD/PsrC family molybdoenzyme membrane anchor subunit [Anaerolineales bacterium]
MNQALLIRKLPSRLGPALLAWAGLIGLLLLVGGVAALRVFRQGLVLTNLSNSIPWGLWITIDLSAIALGAGAFTLSAIVYLFHLEHFRPILRLAVLVGLVGYTTAMLTLLVDIGRPDRFWHPWVYWNVHSVLWEITLAITLYTAVMMVEFAPVVAELPLFDQRPRLRRLGHWLHKAAPALALAGLLISIVHQSSLGATYGILKARPVWFKPSMPILFIVSAVAVGPAVTMAAAFIVEWATRRPTIPHDLLRTIARISGIGLLVYAYLRFWDLAAVSYYGRTPAAEAAMQLLQQYTPYGFGFWFGEVIIGLLIPVILFLLPRFNRRPGYLVLGAGLAALGIVINRWNITVSGLLVPLNYSPGVVQQLEPGIYTPSLIEWTVVLGVVGYALAAFTLGIRSLPIFTWHQTNPK